MSIIKEIYDVAKDSSALVSKNVAIKRALKTELKLNRKFLMDIEKPENIDNKRRVEIIKMLDITEISAAVKYDIPYVAISRKKVSEELAKKYKISRMENADFEKLIEGLYLMISYLQKDHRNKKINLNLRLINIYKYNRLLLDII